MSFPNLSSFRGVSFNDDTTSSRGQPADPDQQPDVGIEKGTFGDITVIEYGGMGHHTISMDVLVISANWAAFVAGNGQLGTLIQRGITRSTTARMTSLTNRRISVDGTYYTASATWVW